MWHMRQTRPLSTRVIAALLAVITAFSCVPTQALAEAAAAVAPEAEQQVDATDAADDAAAGDTVAGDDAATANASSADGEKDADAEGAAEADGATAEQPDGVAVQSYITIDTLEIADTNEVALGSTDQVTVGDTISVVGSYYDEDDDWDYDIPSSYYSSMSYQWYRGTSQVKYSASAAKYASYEAIDGATSRELEVTADLAGSYLACKVTYNGGQSLWTFGSTYLPVKAAENPNVSPDAKTLAEVKQKLSSWKPNPAYGTDTNIVDMLSAKLKALGYANVTASLKSV